MMKATSERCIAYDFNHIRAITFGIFRLLVDGQEVHFTRSKSKELLAFLIDQHGKRFSKKQLAQRLFPEKEYDTKVQDYMKKIVKDLKICLNLAGAGAVFRCEYNAYSVDMEKFTCDLYEYETDEVISINAFKGEYMKPYSWAEETLIRLR